MNVNGLKGSLLLATSGHATHMIITGRSLPNVVYRAKLDEDIASLPSMDLTTTCNTSDGTKCDKGRETT